MSKSRLSRAETAGESHLKVSVRRKGTKRVKKVKTKENVSVAASNVPGACESTLIVILSSAKTLDFTTEVSDVLPAQTQPSFIEEAAEVNALLRGLSLEGVMRIMRISSSLAKENVHRIASWNKTGQRPSLCAYSGGVFRKIDSASFTAEDWIYAQRCLRVVSGLYGLLRPLDAISPYRLEMSVKLRGISPSDSLYDFWQDRLLGLLPSSGLLVNLASAEYSTVLDEKKLAGLTWIDVDFREKNGRIVSVHAKAARGLMARFVVKKRCSTIDDLKSFDDGGYQFVKQTPTLDVQARSRIKLTFSRQV